MQKALWKHIAITLFTFIIISPNIKPRHFPFHSVWSYSKSFSNPTQIESAEHWLRISKTIVLFFKYIQTVSVLVFHNKKKYFALCICLSHIVGQLYMDCLFYKLCPQLHKDPWRPWGSLKIAFTFLSSHNDF